MKRQAETYKNAQKTAMSAREAEALVLKKSAYLIEQSVAAPTDEALMLEAWQLAHGLWSFFRQDALSETSPLPAEIKANVVSLSIFVDKRLIAAAHSQKPEDMLPIVNINRQLAEGLMGHEVELPGSGGEPTQASTP